VQLNRQITNCTVDYNAFKYLPRLEPCFLLRGGRENSRIPPNISRLVGFSPPQETQPLQDRTSDRNLCIAGRSSQLAHHTAQSMYAVPNKTIKQRSHETEKCFVRIVKQIFNLIVSLKVLLPV